MELKENGKLQFPGGILAQGQEFPVNSTRNLSLTLGMLSEI